MDSSSDHHSGYDQLVKMLVIGDIGVGKTSLITRFTCGKFALDPKPTPAKNSVARHVYVNGKVIKAQILDVAGNHRYRPFTDDVHVKNAQGVLIVHDVTRASTLENVEKWYGELKAANGEIEVMLVGNKADILNASVPLFSEAGMTFAETKLISYIETSAKDDINVEKAFAELVTKICRNIINDYDTMNAVDAPKSASIYSEAQVSRGNGKNEPAHYMLKIESFSLLSEARTDVFESDVFEASGYKWRIELYPNGNEEENAGNHISLYVSICNTESLPMGWEVCVRARFCVYDHVRQNYMIFQADVDEPRTRFNAKKKKWGFNKLISLDYFNDAGSGCLFQDSCIFGAEVFVAPKYAEIDQCLSMIKPPEIMNTHTWLIENFSTISEVKLYSDYFKVGKVKWKISMYPKGDEIGKAGPYLSLFLKVHDSDLLPDGWRSYANFRIRVKNHLGFADREIAGNKGRWFLKVGSTAWGYSEFMLLSELVDPAKGFLLHDDLTVEADILVVGKVKNFK